MTAVPVTQHSAANLPASSNMNAKILIVALCAFQLAVGDFITDITKLFQDDVRSRTAEAQAQAASATQSIQNAAQIATLNITLQIEAGLNSAQRYANTLNISAQQAQACLSNQTQQYTAIANATQAQIQQQVSSQISQIQAATQKFNASVNNANNNVSQISSQFNSCLGRSCSTTATSEVTRAATAFDDAFQSSTQIFSQISTSATGGDTAQALNQTSQTAATQLQQVSQQTTQCLQRAAASGTPAAASTASGSADNSTAAIFAHIHSYVKYLILLPLV